MELRKLSEAGIVVAGGHTIDDTEPKYGLVVTGIVNPNDMWSNNGARAGDILLLTKPLGTGVITTALKNEILTEEDVAPAVQWMKMLNKDAAIALEGLGIRAATDITGNGFLGHAAEMSKASNVRFVFNADAFPVLDAAWPLAEHAKVPGGTKMNKLYLGSYVTFSNVSVALKWILYDAQTSGGLLISIPRERLSQAKMNLENNKVFFAEIGEVTEGSGIEVVGR